ncbi:MAG: diacylglycerol kinase family lipid kinase [Cyclobacteriaceae bacterium]|nr:diacylglycerol kinase family lipid kinase [Cyclobacteriaceae bacterium]
MDNYLIVANPRAGRRNSNPAIKKIRSFFDRKGLQYELQLTTKARNAKIVVEEHFTPYFTHVIMAGGDGTINEGLNGLPDFDRPFGVIPCGSGNDFAKYIDIGHHLEDHLETVISNQILEVDVGLCNDRRFVNGVGLGFDGQIVYNMENSNTWIHGHAAYYYHVIRILGSYKERRLRLVIDGKQYVEDILILIMGNGSTFGGGFKLAPQADITDGLLSICIVRKVAPLMRFFYINRMKSGTHATVPGVEFMKAREVYIEEADIMGQIDGELTDPLPLHLRMAKEKLKVLACGVTMP